MCYFVLSSSAFESEVLLCLELVEGRQEHLHMIYHQVVNTVVLLVLWRSGLPQKCHPAVDLRSGLMDTWTTSLGSEKRTTVTQERLVRENLCWCSVYCEAQGET